MTRKEGMITDVGIRFGGSLQHPRLHPDSGRRAGVSSPAGQAGVPSCRGRDKFVVVKCGKRDCVLLVDVRRNGS